MKVVFGAWIAVAFVLVALALVGYADQFRFYWSIALQSLSALFGAALCFRTYTAFPAGSPLGLAWGLIGAGLLAWGIGATIYAIYPLVNVGQETPYPYYSDFGYLAAGPLIVAGLLYFKQATELSVPPWGKIAAVAVLLLAGAWAYLANSQSLIEGDTATKLASLGYILFDPILMATTVMMASALRAGVVAEAWWYVVAGVTLFFAANQTYAYLVAQESYASGSWIDAGWIVGFGLIAYAAVNTRKILSTN